MNELIAAVEKVKIAWAKVWEPTARALGLYRLLDWLAEQFPPDEEETK